MPESACLRLIARVVVAGVVIAVLPACGDDVGNGAASESPGFDADPFVGTAPTVVGDAVDLTAYADRDLVIWFWAPW